MRTTHPAKMKPSSAKKAVIAARSAVSLRPGTTLCTRVLFIIGTKCSVRAGRGAGKRCAPPGADAGAAVTGGPWRWPGGKGVSFGSARVRDARHGTPPAFGRGDPHAALSDHPSTPGTRVILRLAMHRTGRRGLIRPDPNETP
ncbi:hypothetical protein ACE1SV_07520 [Streptomyces sp. E-15]